jgi:chromatin remodeling complex protein RSC6
MAKKATSRKTGKSKSARGSRGSAKSTRSAKSAKRGGAKKAAKSSRKRAGGGRGTANAAFMRPMTPSSALAEVVGSTPIPRSEVTKRLWAYIKKNRLQDQKNRRMVNADAALKPVFGGKSSVNMFEMTKLVNKQLK